MVLYDDKKWLCKLIRTAFTIEDDTGICEKVLKDKPYLGPSEFDEPESGDSDESYDIREGAEVSHRRRSNTALRLEKLEMKRRAQNEIKVIRLNPDEPVRNELLFKRDTTFREKSKTTPTSIFSTQKLLDSVSNPESIPYMTYARFEASCQPAFPSKRMAIFLTFLEPSKRAYPLHVSVTATAKVIDLIGLILWLTTQNFPGIQLGPVNQYNLQIADDDGEWDIDFPALDHLECVAKFSFSHLALVRCEDGTGNRVQTQKPTFSILLPNRTTFRTSVDDLDITVGQLIRLILDKSGWNKQAGRSSGSSFENVGYHLEKLGEPLIKFIDPHIPVSQCKCRDFCLVRDGAKSVQEVPTKVMGTNPRNPSELVVGRSDLYPVMVSTGRFNKIRNALCVIWSGDRMDLEFQHKNKTKSYPLNLINGVKYDATKNKIVLTLLQPPSAGMPGSQYLSGTNHLTFITSEARIAAELYQHFNTILTSKK